MFSKTNQAEYFKTLTMYLRQQLPRAFSATLQFTIEVLRT